MRSVAPPGAASGFTLVEVVISILLVAVIATSIFAVVLTVRSDTLKSDVKIQAVSAANLVLDKLGNYVTASLEAGRGPNTLCAANTWALPLPGVACGDGTYALASGVHDVSGYLPSNLTAPPYGMSMKYTVTDMGPGGQPDSRFRVTVQVQW